MTDELIRQIVIAVGGAIVGYIAGRYERRRAAGKQAPGRHPRRRWRDVAGTLFGVVVVTSFVVTYVQGEARTDCFRGYFTEVSRNLAERSAATGAGSAAQKALLRATLAGDPERSVVAIQDYLSAIEELERVRAASPSPQPPECG